MPQVDPSILKDFGKAVLRARALKGWDQPTLGAKVEPPVTNSLISKIEKGRKPALSARTVGRFIKALDLDENWVDKFLDVEDTEDGDETKAEREADLVVERLQREGVTAGASDDLLIQLANNFTEGDHKDRDTAYRSVRRALEELATNKDIIALAGNADAQFAALMQQVDALNEDGEFEEAARMLDGEGDRIERLSELHFKKQLSQDRLRNRPEQAAKRLIADLHRKSPAGGVFWATSQLTKEWIDNGDAAGDMFSLQVALEMAKINYSKAKGKKPLEAAALYNLGLCYFPLAERSAKDGHLRVAKNALEAALKKTNKSKDPLNWATQQDGLGTVLREIGERGSDPLLLQSAVDAHRAVLEVGISKQSQALKLYWNYLGAALQTLGEVTGFPATLSEAEDAFFTSLALTDKIADPLDWEYVQNNLGLTQRWLGAVSKDPAKLVEARAGYGACEALNFNDEAPFKWAALQWNIADLALARYRLDADPAHLVEARSYLTKARAFFCRRVRVPDPAL